MIIENNAYRLDAAVAIASVFILVWLSIGCRHHRGGWRPGKRHVLGYPYSGPLEILGLTGFFVAQFVGAAWLFRHAARR